MSQVESDKLKKLEKLCAWRASIFLNPSLYMAIKLTFPTNIGGIVEGRIMSVVGSGSLGAWEPGKVCWGFVTHRFLASVF